MNAFVTDGDQRSALAITRSLGRRGVSVVVGEERHPNLSSSSRYAVSRLIYPSPYTQPDAFQQFLQELVKRERFDVVIPVTDVTMHVVARDQETLGRHTALAVPPFEAFDLVANKWALLQRAAACGIPIPHTHFVDGLEGLNAVIDQVEYPAVVKSARSKIHTERGWVPTVVQYAHSREDLARRYQQTDCLASYPSLIQERIVGSGMGVFVLCNRGRLVTTFAHRRVRERPPSGGQGVLCESVALDPRLRDDAMRLLGPLGWHGVAMLEYKQDCRTGRTVLMEVNGRFWGSLQLAVEAGVDFPFLNYQLAMGWPLDLPDTYRIGVKSRWLLGDLDHLLLRLFRSGRDLPESAPSKLRTLADFARSAGPRNEVFKREDPAPALREFWQYTKALSASAMRPRLGLR